jgi:signal transduction histidine kinase
MSAKLLHSIRNPLTSIGGTSRLLTRKTDDAYLLKFLEIITEETGKIERILDDLFTYAIDTKLKLGNHSLYSLIRKTAMFFYTQLEEKEVSLHLELEGQDPILYLDENKIRQVFVHLIKNSIEAVESGGIIQILGHHSPTTVTLVFQDNGCGISTEDLPHVTDPFFTTKPYGVGLGLAVVNQVLSAHGAGFTFSTNPDRGTTVSVSFSRSISQE